MDIEKPSVVKFDFLRSLFDAYDRGEEKFHDNLNNKDILLNMRTIGSIAIPYVSQGVDMRYANDEFAMKYVDDETKAALKNSLAMIASRRPRIIRQMTMAPSILLPLYSPIKSKDLYTLN
jgi:hypothetical protein